MREKTFLKLFTSYVAVLCFAILLAPGFAMADTPVRTGPETVTDKIATFSEITPGANTEALSTNTAITGINLTEATEAAQLQYPNDVFLFAKALITETIAPGNAAFKVTFTIPEGSPLIGQTPANAIRFFGASKSDFRKIDAFQPPEGLDPEGLYADPAGLINGTIKAGEVDFTLVVENIVHDLGGTGSGISDQDVDNSPVEIYLLVYAWAGTTDAISNIQGTADTDANYYTLVARDADEPAGINDFEPATSANTDPFYGAGVNTFQSVTIEKGLINDTAWPEELTNQAIIYKMNYNSGTIEGGKTFAKVKLEDFPLSSPALFGDQETAGEKAPSDLAHGEWAVYDDGDTSTVLGSGAAIVPNTDYDIYYAVALPDTFVSTFHPNPMPATQSTRLIAPKPLTAGTGEPFVAALVDQADDKLNVIPTAFDELYQKTTKGDATKTKYYGYGFEIDTEGKVATATVDGESVNLTSDVTDILDGLAENAKPAFVTYQQNIIVEAAGPGFVLAEGGLFNLTPTTDHIEPFIEILAYGADGKEIPYTLVDDAAEAKAQFANNNYLAWIVGPGATSKTATLPTPALDTPVTYNVFYTAPINGNEASANVAIKTRTALLDLTAPTQSAFLNNGSPVYADYGVPHLVEDQALFGLHIDENSNNVVGLGAQRFDVTGLSPGSFFEMKREFTYFEPTPLPAGFTAPLINEGALSLSKFYDSGAAGAAPSFNFVSSAGVPTAIADVVDGTAWIVDNKTGVAVNFAASTPFVNGRSYTVHFLIKDGGPYDNDGAVNGRVLDPNFLNLGGHQYNSGNSSSGCSVGSTSAYDMALLLIAILGLVGLRFLAARTRKS